MYTPYLLVMTMFSGAGEVVDSRPYASLGGCEAALERMRESVEEAWAEHGIIRTSGECRAFDPDSWSGVATRRPARASASATE